MMLQLIHLLDNTWLRSAKHARDSTHVIQKNGYCLYTVAFGSITKVDT